MNWRRVGAGVVLAAVWGAVPVLAQMAGQTVKGFHLPEYDEQGKLTQQMFGETATFLEGGIIQLTGLRLELFRDGEVTARVFSPDCAYDPGRKRAASKEHIRIVAQKAVLTGDGFAWNGENEQFQIFQNAKVVLDARLEAERLVAPPAADASPGAAGSEP